jgi:hypothetical protein
MKKGAVEAWKLLSCKGCCPDITTPRVICALQSDTRAGNTTGNGGVGDVCIGEITRL